MLDKIQDRSWLQMLSSDTGIHLHGAQRALSQWAIVDDYNAVLDLQCQNSALLSFLSHKFRLRAVGIAPNDQTAVRLKHTASGTEIICAKEENIPYEDDVFDAVFYQTNRLDDICKPAVLQEALRVLKPDGQMLIAVKGMKNFIQRAFLSTVLEKKKRPLLSVKLLQTMENAGFQDVSYRMTQPFVGVAMGWKKS